MDSKSSPSQSSTDSSHSPLNMYDPLVSSNPQANQPTLTHLCPHCTRTFSSAQALGGHQNAHRKERSEARRQLAQQRAACNHAKRANFSSPRYLSVAPPCGGPNPGPMVVAPPMVRPGPVYGTPAPGSQAGVGYRPPYEQGLGVQPGNGFMAGYGFPSRPPCENYYCQPYVRPVITPQMNHVEARSTTVESQAYARYLNGGEDCTEATSKRRMDLTLGLSP